jgi:hypothetical protein
VNEETLAHWGLLRQKEEEKTNKEEPKNDKYKYIPRTDNRNTAQASTLRQVLENN